jgi:hypothetical protein
MYKPAGSGGVAMVQVEQTQTERAAQVNERVSLVWSGKQLGWVWSGEQVRQFGLGEWGFPLQSPPLLEKHQPDVCVMEEMGQKGIKPKAMIQMRCGAAGFWACKSATFSGVFSTFSKYS